MPRLDALTGLRWWAAFVVFLYHMLVFAPLSGNVDRVLSHGYLGVTFFFVLSGFVLTWSLSSRISRSTFYWRRFARIYPAHVVALLFAIPVFYSFTVVASNDWHKPVDIGILALSFVLLQGWSLNPAILFSGNPAAWTLTCEAFFYALHPFIGRFLTRLGRWGALGVALGIVVVALGYRSLTISEPGAWFSALPIPVVRLPEFVLGMALAWAFRCGWRPRIPVSLGIAVLLAVIVAASYLPEVAPGSLATYVVANYLNEFFTIACAVLIVAVVSRTLSGKRSMFASRIQVILGEWSFAFYLVHASFIYLALALFGMQPAMRSNILWYIPLLIVCLGGAAALHYGVEKPLEKRMRAWKDSRAAAAMPAGLSNPVAEPAHSIPQNELHGQSEPPQLRDGGRAAGPRTSP